MRTILVCMYDLIRDRPSWLCCVQEWRVTHLSRGVPFPVASQAVPCAEIVPAAAHIPACCSSCEEQHWSCS
jgi:hypothetical protein